MRAHFQNEHVGGSQDVVKACPLCAYKAGRIYLFFSKSHFSQTYNVKVSQRMLSDFEAQTSLNRSQI